MSEREDFLAMRYALGVADLKEITVAETRLEHDPEFAAAVAQFEAHFFGMDGTVTPMAPTGSVWERIEDAIDETIKSGGTQTIRAQDLAWEPFLPGVDRKVLRIDKAAASSQILYRVAPGAEVGNHSHAIIEECLVLEGEIEVDGIIVRAGDMHLAFPGERHGPLYSRNGAVVYIRGDLQIQP